MATKLKNLPYNPFIKFLSVLLLLISVGVLTVSIVLMSDMAGGIGESSYYGTSSFYYDYGRISHNAIEKYLDLKSEKHILETVEEEAQVNSLIRRLRDIDENLDKASGFIFIFENVETGELITNIAEEDPVEHIKSRKTSILYEYESVYLPEGSVLGENKGYHNYGYLSSDILGILSSYNEENDETWRYYSAIMDKIPEDDGFFYEDKMNFDRINQYQDLIIAAMSVAGVIGVVVLLYYWFVAGKSQSDMKVKLSSYDEIPQEVQSMVTGALVAPFAGYMSLHEGYVWNEAGMNGLIILVLFIEIFAVAVLVQYTSLIRLIKSRQFFRKLAIVRIVVFLVGLIRLPRFDQPYKLKVLLWVGAWLLANGIGVGVMAGLPPIGIIILIAINVIAFKRLFTLIDQLKELMTLIHERRLGLSTDSVDVSKLPTSLVSFGEDLDALQEGLDIALEDRIRGEKLKTELITNVTHDLKNPLTSIISYVELLKTKDSYDDETRKYIGVLDEKANRLKGLIEQLVDASKASSGNVDVSLQAVDMVQLSRQLCGEFAEKMEERSLECIVSNMEHPHYVLADPVVLYRILENLMSNVHKYSMQGTRVYVDMVEGNDEVTYAIKNISSDPLNIEVEDLSRRFVRGDSSRNTEGSGLGLSIALSLAKLIGAHLEFEIDGDLFKAILKLKGTEVVPESATPVITTVTEVVEETKGNDVE